jgi:ABC-2 type transport system permease protein
MKRFLFVARAVAWRSIHNMLANPKLLLPSVIPPLFFLAAFAGGLSKITAVPNFNYKPGYTAFEFIFTFMQSATLAGVFTGFGVARDFDSGYARRLLLAAPARSGIIVGYLAAALVRFAVAGTVVTVAAVIAGVGIPHSGTDIVGLVGLAILANTVAALWACGTAMFLRTEQAGALIQLPVFVLLFLAPVYVPANLLTGWIHSIANVNPTTILLEAGRGFLASSPSRAALAYGLLAAGIVVLAVWARRGLASAERAGQ